MVHHFFLPHKHKKKHRKARLLSHKALALYIVFFIAIQLGFAGLRTTQPGVLGTTSAITKQQVIDLTNTKRKEFGISALKENSELDKAAELKAKNMFAENYWAHVSPSGSTPWLWFQQAGYKYEYAGENLARGFSTSSDTMDAWMASTMGHKENVLGENYQEVGIAVEDGILNGEKTTLVVQLFGTQQGAIATKPEIGETGTKTVNDSKIATNIPSAEIPVNTQEVNSATTTTPTQPSFLSRFININPNVATRSFSFSIIALLTFLGLIDLLVMWRRRSLAQLHIRHLPHVSVISVMLLVLLVMRVGSII